MIAQGLFALQIASPFAGLMGAQVVWLLRDVRSSRDLAQLRIGRDLKQQEQETVRAHFAQLQRNNFRTELELREEIMKLRTRLARLETQLGR